MLNIRELKKIASENPSAQIEITLEELLGSDFRKIPENISLYIFIDDDDEDFPSTEFWREDNELIAEVTFRIHSKYWTHKYHASVFADAMVRAVNRLRCENHPFGEVRIEVEDDIRFYINYELIFNTSIDSDKLIESVKAAEKLVWKRANSILENSDSILILGKDTGESLKRLEQLKSLLEDIGYYVYLIKEQPDKLGESLIQKVLRYALSSKFIIIENSIPSGHLYEIPHVTKMAESVTIILQEENKGATWMFEDAYFKHNHWKKFVYTNDTLLKVLKESIDWAEGFINKFEKHQINNLPWIEE